MVFLAGWNNAGSSLITASSGPMTKPGKSYTGEGSASFENLEKPVWRPKGRQLNKFSSVLLTKIKKVIAYF